MDTSETTFACISISNDVISKMRSEVDGVLNQSLLSKIHANWQRKMIEAGVISEATLPSSASFPFPSPVIVPAPPQTQDTNPLPGDAASGIDIDAQAQLPSKELVMSTKNDIPQKDGSGDGDAVSKPDTYAPYDEDDEDLNENDDVEEEGGIIDDDNIPYLIICQFDHVKRKRATNKWDCKFKAGFMQINDKEILFTEAKGDFNF
ncbi:hypothetical protein Bca4012_025428 [Brassica carinata]|uniref:Uncharacterized protein n=1 Tax=Brassica carinata TaxID=52824 RepID=A0A8X7VGE9_BRACI|nr:hypothetical protein Bca52824_022476 [Brassica carinata]